MDQVHRIRDLYYGQDKSLSEIAKIENLDWRTVREYVDREDFNKEPALSYKMQSASKPDPFKPIINTWLLENKKAPRKKRHTARRIHAQLQTKKVCNKLQKNFAILWKKGLQKTYKPLFLKQFPYL